MKKRLLSIWKDPVFSGLVVALIAFIGGGIWSYFNWEKTKKFFIDCYNGFINFNIPFYYVILGIIAIVMFIWLFSKLFGNKVKSKEEYFSRDDYRFTFTNVNILCRYGVFINYYTGKPDISHLKIYCNHHSPALELENGRCVFYDCDNHKNKIDIYQVEKFLEAEIIERWEKYDEGIR